MAYMTMFQYHDAKDNLLDVDGCNINGDEFSKYINYRGTDDYVWTVWDSPDRGGLQSYLTENDCITLGLIRTSPNS